MPPQRLYYGHPHLQNGYKRRKSSKPLSATLRANLGLSSEILSDVDHVLLPHFFTCLCRLSSIRQHQSVIYRPKGNGRTEAAVWLTIESLRKILNELTHDLVNWVTALPLALWNLNDLPGVYNPYSPHYLVFGWNPISFGDVPPLEEPQDCPDATQ